jgi:hypothetical protein
MSKLSIHISKSPPGLDDWLLTCAEAGSPVSVIYSVNENIAESIKRSSPTTRWIYRRQTEQVSRLPNNFWNDDPAKNATRWLVEARDPADQQRTQIENWTENRETGRKFGHPPAWYDPLNEPPIPIADPNNSAEVADAIHKAQYLNTWMMTALNLADGLGFKLALFSFATEAVALDKRIWNELTPAFKLGKQLGAILSLHAYGGAHEGASGPLHDRPQAYLWHRDIYKLLPEDVHLPIVYSECGADNGFDTGKASRGSRFIADLAACDADWMADASVLAACAYQIGHESNMPPDIFQKLGDYIGTHPTPNAPPPHIAPPQAASAEGTLVPPDMKITDSAGHVWSLGEQVVHGRVLLRGEKQFADGQGVLLLFHDQQVFTQNDQNQWFVATDTAWQPIPNDPRA